VAELLFSDQIYNPSFQTPVGDIHAF